MFLCFILCVVFFNSYADDTYYNKHATGWHWYDDPKEQGENDDNSNPAETMDAVKATIQRSLDKAVLNPSVSNVSDYLTLQNQMMQKANLFKSAWKAALLQHPELDYSLIHPTNTIAKQVEYDQENKNEEMAIKKLADESGLFFFYRSTCPYCQRFAPIVKDFAEHYHITVIAITTDDNSLPEFPNSYPDQGQAAKFHVTVEPSLFAVNPYTREAYPVSYGLMSEVDLKKRILDIATRFGAAS